MATILFIWTMLTTTSAGGQQHWNWVNSGEFRSMERCQAAIKQLSIDPAKARCIEN